MNHFDLGRIPHDDEADREVLAGLANYWLGQLDQAAWPRAIQGFENVSYLCGNHLTRYFFDPATGGLGAHTFGRDDRSPYDSIIAQVADNRLINPVESVISMLTRAMPEPRVKPASDRPSAEDVARVAALLVELLFEDPLDMNEIRYEAALLACALGTVIAETTYDETDAFEVVVEERVRRKRNPLFGKLPAAPEKVEVPTTPKETAQSIRDFQVNLLTPYHFDPDPSATNERNASWFRKTTLEDKEWIKEAFDSDAEGFYPENLDRMTNPHPAKSPLFWWNRMADILDSPQHDVGSTLLPLRQQVDESQVPLTYIDVRPTQQFPKGRTLVLAGGALLYCGDARGWSERYPRRWHRYRFFHWFKLASRFFGIAPLSLALPLQKRINAIDAHVRANRSFLAIGQWIYAKQSKVAPGSITGLWGSHITYTSVPGVPAPARVQHQPLPGELLAERALLADSIDRIFASGNVPDGVSGSAARSGSMFETWRQDKLESKAPMLQRYQSFIEGIGQDLLIEAQEEMGEADPALMARMNALAKARGYLPIEEFTGASIQDHHTVNIDIVSSVMNTPEAERERAQAVLQFAGPQLTPQQLQGIFKAMDLDKYLTSPENASIERARRMIDRIYGGMIKAAFPMPDVDAPMLMAPIFQQEMSSERFLHADPKAQQAISQMFDYYMQAAREQAQAVMQQQQAHAQAGAAKPKEKAA